ADDKRSALDEVVIDGHAAHVLLSGLNGGLCQIIRLGDLASRVGGDRELPCAILRVGRKLIQPRDAIGRNPDNRRTGRIELILHLGESVRFEVASLGVCRRIKVNDRGALLQALASEKLNSLPASEARAEKSGAFSPGLSAARRGKPTNNDSARLRAHLFIAKPPSSDFML